MARIELKQPGQSVANFSVDGALITVEGIAVDCQALQQDTTEIVEVRRSASGIHLGGDGAYVAQIEIPARVYLQRDLAVAGDTQEGEAQPVAPDEAVPLDANAILITLWPTAG